MTAAMCCDALKEVITREVVRYVLTRPALILSYGELYDLLRGIGIKANTEEWLEKITEIVPGLRMIKEWSREPPVRWYMLLPFDLDDAAVEKIALVAKVAYDVVWPSNVTLLHEIIAKAVHEVVGAKELVDRSYARWYWEVVKKAYGVEP